MITFFKIVAIVSAFTVIGCQPSNVSFQFIDNPKTSEQYDSMGYPYGDDNFFRLYDSARMISNERSKGLITTSVLVEEWRCNKIRPLVKVYGDSVLLTYRIWKTARKGITSVEPLLIRYSVPVDSSRSYKVVFDFQDTVFHKRPPLRNRERLGF